MDPLSDLLRIVRLDGAFFYAVDAANPWRVEAAPSATLSPRILPDAEHLISYHIVTQGRCVGGLLGEEPLALVAGDVIVFPHGDGHQMASPNHGRAPTMHTAPGPERYREKVILGSGPPTVSFVCGFLGIDRRPFNPLLATLPRVLHVRGLPTAWYAAFTRQVTEESRHGRAGADTILTRLAEVMFIEVLRRYLDAMPAGQTGWLAGLRDDLVGRTLALIHARPGNPWTLVSLAREVNSSRSSLARRFMEVVGQPPMQYLAQWRMQVAATLLSESGAKVSSVAREVGYDSEAAFSRAFKKATGHAPGAWRETRRNPRR